MNIKILDLAIEANCDPDVKGYEFVTVNAMANDCFGNLLAGKSQREMRRIITFLQCGWYKLPARMSFVESEGVILGVCVPLDSSLIHFYVGDVRVCTINPINMVVCDTIYKRIEFCEIVVKECIKKLRGRGVAQTWQVKTLEKAAAGQNGFLFYSDGVQYYLNYINTILDDKKQVGETNNGLKKKPRSKKFNSPF